MSFRVGCGVEVLAQHRGVGDPGTDTVASDAVAGVVQGDGAGQLQHGALGGGINGGAALAHETADRSEVDHVTTPVLAQMRERMFEGEEHGFDVHAYHAVPLFRAVVMEHADVNDAGVVDQDLETAEGGDGLGDRGAYLLFPRDVATDEDRFAALSFD